MNDERRMEAEKRYISSDITLAALAQEMGLPLNTLKVWCKKYNWVKERQKAQKRAMRKAITRVTDKKAKDLAKLLEASGEVEKALLAGARAFAEKMEKNPLTIVDGRMRASNLSSLTHALGRQTETRMMLGGILSETDRQKLELLRREQERKERETDAKQAGEGPQEIRITYQGVEDMEAYHE